MLSAWYIGNHHGEGLKAKLGQAVIRLGQSGQRFGHITHVEAIHGGTWRMATIASASVRDGNRVRTKVTDLNPRHWQILWTPGFDLDRSKAWFAENDGKPYSMLGAASSASMLVDVGLRAAGVRVSDLGQWCSRSFLESVGIIGAEDMSVSEAMTMTINTPGTIDVTQRFFSTDITVDEFRI